MNSGQTSARKPRILVTRAAGQASVLAEELERLGARPVIIPAIEIAPPDSYEVLDGALMQLERFDWLIVTSANAVTAIAERVEQLGVDLPLDALKIAAIGSATARALEEQGWRADLVPASAVAESLAEALIPYAQHQTHRATRFLLIRAQEGRDMLPQALDREGGEVTVAPAYKTQVSRAGLQALQAEFAAADDLPDGVTLTSSSAARNFFALMSEAGIAAKNRLTIASIGAITSQTLRHLGHPPHVEAQEATVISLANAIMRYLREARRLN